MPEPVDRPNVEEIIAELQRGIADTTPPLDTHPDTGTRKKIQSCLRKASETVDVMGRTGGSLRGKLCRMLSWFAWPVIEQINLHNKAVLDPLNRLYAYQKEELEPRIAALEEQLKKQPTEKDS